MKFGLYASIAPLVAYALFGTSRTLAVGPVAVVSLLTAAAVGKIAEQGSADYVTAAFTLALLSGAMLLALGLFRLGALASLLSHPVIAGFISASGLLIAASQLKHILGVGGEGDNLVEIASSLASRYGRTKGSYEYQMLFGIRTAEQTRLAENGETMRVYIPYGTEWYGYLMRRLAERPQNLTFFMRSLLSKK